MVYTPSQFYGADEPFIVPQQSIRAVRSATGDRVDSERIILDVFHPEGVPRLWVLGPCADVSRDQLERLMRPVTWIEIGSRVAVAAAAETRKLPAPDTFCSEGSLLRGAYAGLQDWDYLSTSRFAQRNDFALGRIRHWFDIDQHPTKMITLIPAAAMFLRGDVAPAKQQVVAALDRQQELDLLPRQHPWSLVDLGPHGVPPEATLVHRVALAVEGQTASSDALRPDQVKLPTDDFVSDTGQLEWDLRRPGHGVVTVDTPRSKALVGYGSGARYELGGLVIEPGQTRQDGWSALTLTAIEGDLATAPSRWLITATGYVENTDMGWKDTEHTSVGSDWGNAPTLVEGIPARFTVPFAPECVEVWALDERGQRRIAVPCRAAPGGHAVIAIGPEWKTLWYEVAVRGRSSGALRNQFQPTIVIAATSVCPASH